MPTGTHTELNCAHGRGESCGMYAGETVDCRWWQPQAKSLMYLQPPISSNGKKKGPTRLGCAIPMPSRRRKCAAPFIPPSGPCPLPRRPGCHRTPVGGTIEVIDVATAVAEGGRASRGVSCRLRQRSAARQEKMAPSVFVSCG